MLTVTVGKTPFGTFRGQRGQIVEFLKAHPDQPVTLDQMVTEMTTKYEPTLSNWAKEKAGGVRGSLRYHLNALKKLGQVILTGEVREVPARVPAPTEAAPKKPPQRVRVQVKQKKAA